MVTATLGLLAFMLAFTFGLASSRFDDRRQFVLDEANAIRTCYLRSAFLSEPQRSTIRGLLSEYLAVRLEEAEPRTASQAIATARRLHDHLWTEAVAAGEKDPRSNLAALFFESLNQMINVHEKRVLAGQIGSVPQVIWITLYLVAALSMVGIGYHEGLTSLRRSPAALALVLSFAAVISLIADLDRPQEGLVNVSQKAMIDLANTVR